MTFDMEKLDFQNGEIGYSGSKRDSPIIGYQRTSIIFTKIKFKFSRVSSIPQMINSTNSWLISNQMTI